LKPAQLAHFLGYLDEDVADPRERLQTGLEQARKLQGDAWAARRDEIAEEVGWLVAGVASDRASRIQQQAAALLDRAHALAASEFKKQRCELNQAAEQIVGDIGPTLVLQHTVEHALAEMLSNPRLGAALRSRLH
jgi:hypothetical protein